MDCNVTSISRRRAAESLPSTVIGMGIASLLFIALASVYLFSTRSFVDLGNYMDLDSRARVALDTMSRDIRQADRLTSYASNAVTFQSGTNQLTFNYDASGKTLTRQLGGEINTLLVDCDAARFDIFQRNPANGAYDYYPTAAATNCKIVQVTLLCSRSVLGQMADSATVQSARVVIRKQR